MDNQSKICIECRKIFLGEESKYFCSERCRTIYDTRDSIYQYGDDEVTCPYCLKEQADIFEGGYYDADEDEFECQYCEKLFILSAETYTRFSAYPTEAELLNIVDKEGVE